MREQVALIEILIFAFGALAFVVVGSFVGSILRPHKPNKEKLFSYESGEDPVGDASGTFNTKFYVLALAFILFEVEAILLFPWAMAWKQIGLNEVAQGIWTDAAVFSLVFFVALLSLGLLYLYSRLNLFNSVPESSLSSHTSKIPQEYYERINRKY